MCVCVLPAEAVTFLGQTECGEEEEDNEILKKPKKTKKSRLLCQRSGPCFYLSGFPSLQAAALAWVVRSVSHMEAWPPTHVSPLCPPSGEGPFPQHTVTRPRAQ